MLCAPLVCEVGREVVRRPLSGISGIRSWGGGPRGEESGLLQAVPRETIFAEKLIDALVSNTPLDFYLCSKPCWGAEQVSGGKMRRVSFL